MKTSFLCKATPTIQSHKSHWWFSLLLFFNYLCLLLWNLWIYTSKLADDNLMSNRRDSIIRNLTVKMFRLIGTDSGWKQSNKQKCTWLNLYTMRKEWIFEVRNFKNYSCTDLSLYITQSERNGKGEAWSLNTLLHESRTDMCDVYPLNWHYFIWC